MKRIIAILLSALIMFSCFAVCAGAEDGRVISHYKNGEPVYQYEVTGQCTCEDHISGEKCHCCVFCKNLDISYVNSCGKDDEDWDGVSFDGTLCCYECTGLWGCTCGCSCCAADVDDDVTDFDNNIDDYWGEQEQENFIEGFQSILKTISDWFDEIFDAIFEFLRLDELLGRE